MAEDTTPWSNHFPDPSSLPNANGLNDIDAEHLDSGPEEADEAAATSADGPVNPQRARTDSHGRHLNPRSCVTCRRRKVRCDKTHPCSNCTRAHIECVYPAPGRAPRRPRKTGDGRDKELLERLRRLEGVVKGLGVDVPNGTEGQDGEHGQRPTDRDASDTPGRGTSDMGAPQAAAASEQGTQDAPDASKYLEDVATGRLSNRFGRLVVNEGKSRYINNSFWASLSNEVEDLKGILNQASDDEDLPSPGSGPHLPGNRHGFVFGFSSQSVDMLSLHPISSQIGAYWQTYKDNVDPLVKVLHVPTVEPTILNAASHLGNLSKGYEALLFAIYYGAVTSLTSEECIFRLGEEKSVLTARYRFGVEQALARANFLTTEEVVVLQAFIIFLICLRRNSDARVIWTLTGLVVRIAQTIGVHRDGTHFNLCPFEIEMRRRVWWQVCILDTRASEDHGCDPAIIEQSFDTKLPLNINDIDISPEMKTFPPERQGCTDMSFCLIRCEVANTFRRINYIPPGPPKHCEKIMLAATLKDKERWITDCHEKLEAKYLKDCDMNVPLYWITATVARLMMSKMWLMAYHPFQRQDGGTSLSTETKEKLFITSLQNIEYSILLQTDTRTKQWGWLFKTYMQWHALAFILSELCLRTKGELVERAWVAVEKTRQATWGDVVTDEVRAGHLWRPLKKLYKKASEAHARGLQEEQLDMQRAVNGPARRYSPNANPMFGHPARPQMVRAPLSQAQLQRFSQGPLYGKQPIDSHELLKSPRGSEAVREVEGDSVAAAANVDSFDLNANPSNVDVQEFTSPSAMNPSAADLGLMQQSTIPTSRGIRFGARFLHPTGQIDFSNLDPLHTGQENINIAPEMISLASTTAPLRMDSMDSNFDPIIDPSGDMDWENWDQLVRQFGMDVDSVPNENGGVNWATTNWGGEVQQNMSNGMEGGSGFSLK